MNILEQEDIIKGLPDQALMQEAQRPSGQVPQYLVVSEIQRRSDMRKRYKSEQEQMPQGTVKDKVVQEGIMASMPPQMAMAPQMAQRMPNMPPPQMPPQGIEQAMPPQMMSGGGIVEMAPGGSMPGAGALYGVQKEYVDPLIERAKVLAEMGVASFEEALAQLRLDAQMNNPDYSMIAPSGVDMPELSTAPQRGAGSRPFDFGGVKQVYSDLNRAALESAAQSVGPIRQYDIDATQRVKDAYRNEGVGSAIGQSIREVPGYLGALGTSIIGDFDRLTDAAADSPIVYEPARALQKLVTGSVPEDPTASFLHIELGDLFGGDDPVVKQTESIQDQNKRLGLGPSGPSGFFMRKDSEPPVTIDGDSTEILGVSDSGIATADPTRKDSKDEAGGINTAGDGKEVQSDSVFSTDDYRSRLEYLMKLGADSDKVEIPTLDYSDIRDDLNRRIQSNMLLQLGAGIAGGDVSKGIQAAGEVSQAGGRDISKIDLAERQGQFEAATAAQKRQDDLLKTQRMLGAELMRLDAKLKVSRDTDKREIIRYYAGIRDGLQDQLVALTEYGQTLPKASQDLMNRIDKMLQNLSSKYGIVLPAEAEVGADLNDPAGINAQLTSRQPAP